MQTKRTSMRKIREVLRLRYDLGLSERQIAKSCGLSRRSVNRYIKRAEQARLPWPLPKELDDEALECLLYSSENKKEKSQPNWQYVHKELKRKGVTLFLLWEEFRSNEATEIGYSRFCQLYRSFKSKLIPVMRQAHKAGEKLFVDYTGMTVPLINKITGETNQAQIFVAVLGASNYTYAEATLTQNLPDWINSHVNALKFFNGVPEIIVPDNLKSGVTKAHQYDPDINPTYQDMANHYGVAIVPARVRKPKDKAKAEVGVQGIERYILAKLRNHTFFNITEINIAIRPLLEAYNKKPFQQLSGSRLSQFIEIDKPALKPLPQNKYKYAEWKKVRINIDYHLSFENHYYSIPHRYIKCELDLRITKTILECFYKGKSIAIHKRAYCKGYTTVKEHMPACHREYAEWTPERLENWALKIGEETAKLIQAMINSRPHPQQAYRACLGVIRLAKSYGDVRLEKACRRALAIGALTYKSIESILKHGLDQKALPDKTEKVSTPTHDNIRGADYYAKLQEKPC